MAFYVECYKFMRFANDDILYLKISMIQLA